MMTAGRRDDVARRLGCFQDHIDLQTFQSAALQLIMINACTGTVEKRERAEVEPFAAVESEEGNPG